MILTFASKGSLQEQKKGRRVYTENEFVLYYQACAALEKGVNVYVGIRICFKISSVDLK